MSFSDDEDKVSIVLSRPDQLVATLVANSAENRLRQPDQLQEFSMIVRV
jgi:hypothetical protein